MQASLYNRLCYVLFGIDTNTDMVFFSFKSVEIIFFLFCSVPVENALDVEVMGHCLIIIAINWSYGKTKSI